MIDGNHAVILAQENLRNHAPKENSIIVEIEKKRLNIEAGGRVDFDFL